MITLIIHVDDKIFLTTHIDPNQHKKNSEKTKHDQAVVIVSDLFSHISFPKIISFRHLSRRRPHPTVEIDFEKCVFLSLFTSC